MNSHHDQQKNHTNTSRLWKETIDPVTGQSSIQIHELKQVFVGCKDGEHYFEFVGGSKREAKCKNCPIMAPFILGYHTIKNGKITIRV